MLLLLKNVLNKCLFFKFILRINTVILGFTMYYVITKSLARSFFAALLMLLAFAVSANGNEAIVRFKAEVTAEQSRRFLSEYGLEFISEVKALNMCAVRLPVSGDEAERLIDILHADERTKYVEMNITTGGGGYMPNDDLIQDQWHHAAINNESAWDITRGSSNVTVAVLDSGIQTSNQEFSGSRFLQGYDFVEDDAVPEDEHSHGTRATGLISANADNNFGGAGVDHNATILPVRVLDEFNSGTTFNLVRGIEYSVAEGADIISMSLINYPGATSLIDAMQAARDAGVILIACAGNGGVGNADVTYPGASPLTISVGATSSSNNRASFSGTGSALDIVAPGSGVFTASYNSSGSSLEFFSGCSAATPVVAGLAALMKSVNPNLTHDGLRDILTSTAQDQVGNGTEDTPGRDDYYGWGLIDSYAAVQAASQSQDSVLVPARIEAEDFANFYETTPDNFGDAACNTGSVDAQLTDDIDGDCNIGWTAAGEWLEYNVETDQSGMFDISLRLASQPGASVSVFVDGVSVGSVSVPGGAWQSYADYALSANLSSGTHTVRVEFDTGDVNFNYMDIQPASLTLPARIEAENFIDAFETTSGNSGDAVCATGNIDSELTGDTDGYCNIGWTAAGEWLEYEVDVASAGSFDSGLRLASSPGGSVSVSVDGSSIGSVFVPSGAWQSYSDYVLSTNLASGTHTIRVSFTTGDVNFNYMDIQFSGQTSPGRIEAENFTAAFDTTSGNRGDAGCNTGDTDSEFTGDVDGECNIGWTVAGEWTEYEISVSESGDYSLVLRAASGVGGSRVYVEIDGVDVTGSISVAQNGWQSYGNYSSPISLSAGSHTVRVVYETGNINLNWLEISN